MLTNKQINQWKTKGWVIIRNFVNVENCIKDMKKHYPIDAKNPVQDFGSDGMTNFPCNYNSINEMSVNINLIKAVKQLLNAQEILLTQSVAWAKYCVKSKDSSSNHDNT